MKKFGLLILGIFIVSMVWGQTIVSYDFSDTGAVSGLDEASPGIALDSNIGFGSFKNSGTSNPAIYYGQLRLYQNATKGGSIKVYASNGVTITQVIVHASDRTGPAAFTVDGGSATDLSGGTTYTMSSLSATSVVEFYQKDSDSGNRIYIDDFEVTYTSGGSTPTIILSESALSGFTYVEGNGPSNSQNFTVEGTNLTNDITISASSNYEISENDATFQSTDITLTQSGGTVSTTTIYVRLKSGLSAGAYNSEDITASSTDADNKTVTCNGDVLAVESLPFSESFDTSSWPAGWTYVDFTIENSNNAGGSAYEAELAYYNAVAGASNLTTPPINTVGETELILAWKQYLSLYESGGTNFTIKIQSSTDGSDFSNEVWSKTVTADQAATTEETTLDAGDGVGSGTLYLRWILTADDGSFSYWNIDDIILSEDSPAVIENVSHSPQNPSTSQTVSVSADITDADGIAGVELHWGTSSGSLGNTIDMSTSGKASYSTDSDIPTQSEGTTVYYEIYVLDNNANETTSDEYNYYVTDATGPSVGDIYISEYSDASGTGNYVYEFLELYSNSSSPLDLSNCVLKQINAIATFTIPEGTIIPAKGFLVVGRNATQSAFETYWSTSFAADVIYLSGDNSFPSINGDEKYLLENNSETNLDPATNGEYSYQAISSGDRVYRLSTGNTESDWSMDEYTNATPGELDPGQTLPVTLSTFTAQYLDSKPTLFWQTQSEEDNMGWFIYRNTTEDFTSAEKVSDMIEGHGSTTQPQDYIYEDTDELQVAQTYYYWLESIDFGGTLHRYDMVVNITIPNIDDPNQNPQVPTLYDISAAPNPFSQSTSITFALTQTGRIDVTIYNIKGEVVKSFDTISADAEQEVSFGWNGKDNSGRILSNGVYLYSIKVNGKDYAAKQLILMR